MTVELSMPEVQTDHPETAELSKPQLRMVDLNLLTVFDAVMQEQKHYSCRSCSGNVATCGQ